MLNSTPWQTGKTYEIDVNVQDNAGNWLVAYSTATNVRADFTNPSSSITCPNNYYNTSTPIQSLPTISGTCAATYPGQVNYVNVEIRCTGAVLDGTPTGYWNGTSWQAAQCWLPISSVTVQGGATWYYNNGGAGCDSIFQMRGAQNWFGVRAYAVSMAGNSEYNASPPSDMVDFYYQVPAGGDMDKSASCHYARPPLRLCQH